MSENQITTPNLENVDKEDKKEIKSFLLEQLSYFGIEDVPSATGIKKLKEMLDEQMQNLASVKDNMDSIKDNSVIDLKEKERKKIKESNKLVRIKLTNLDPNDTARGAIYSVSNKLVSIKKYIPYDPDFYENGYHVPQAIYNQLKNAKFLNITVRSKNGKKDIKKEISRKFSIEVLSNLSDKELQDLKIAQKNSKHTD